MRSVPRAIWLAVFAILADCCSTTNAQTTKPVSRSGAVRAVVWGEGDDWKVGDAVGKGDAFVYDVFGFDADGRKAGPASGSLKIAVKDCPIPRIAQLGGGLSGTMWSECANVVFDLRALTKPPLSLTLGTQKSTDGTECCKICLLLADVKELFVSPDYCVFPDDIGAVKENGPFVQLAFSFVKTGGAADDSVLVVTRNGKEISRTKPSESGVQTIKLDSVKASGDVIEWRVESATGVAGHKGSFGFPVCGAVPGVVEYAIDTSH